MDCTPFTESVLATRIDGWSRERKVRFLDHLAAKGNVSSACAIVGMSREAAYRLRRRDPLFARGWNAALGLARENGTEVLACRAIDGIAEDVWYRGELVGSRVRHDTRLLLAHLARLDRLVDGTQAAQDMGRFDELLAALACEEPPEALAAAQYLPLGRNEAIAEAARTAKAERRHSNEPLMMPDGTDAAEWHPEDRHEALTRACEVAGVLAAQAAAVQWDEWFRRACDRVDTVLADAEPAAPWTVSDLSTSQLPERGEGSREAHANGIEPG